MVGILSFASCIDLDIPPKGTIGDNDLLTNNAGMSIYMARMYSTMPIEDFKYMAEWGVEYNSWLGSMGIEGTGEAVNRDGISTSFRGERTAYWGRAFELLRDANYLIENLPNYKSNFSDLEFDHYMGEAYFVRAFTFYAMARRFGGVPLVTKVMQYPASKSELEVPRSTEQETWDQVLSDFDEAISLLNPKSPERGYSNKYVALAFKAEAMQYAGSVAKYNEVVPGRLTGFGIKTGVRVIGFDENKWQEASNKYFTEAYSAAREIMKNGGYSLYKKKWQANNKEAQYQNMVDMFSDEDSPENIFVREYSYPTLAHGYDAYSSPFVFRAPLSSGTAPTLDFIELFEGFDRYSDGSIKVTSGSSNSQGNYLMYDTPMDFFKNAEPRLRAYVIFPDDRFKGQNIEIRAGVYTGSTPIKPFFNNYSYAEAENRYQHLPQYSGKDKSLYLGTNSQNIDLIEYNGEQISASGKNGPFFDDGESAITGFYGRKWLNPDPAFIIGEGKSDQHFVLMRYADVLLIAAESGVELSLAGVSSPDGSNMLQVATDAVNEIRERAGATKLSTTITSSEQGRNIVRKERRKELAFEHKSKWDIRRWRVQHYDNREGFWGEDRNKDAFSNNALYRFRGLYPFLSTETGQYFFDARFQWVSLKTFEYNPVDYYFAIPGGEVTKSPVIDQQPNR